MSGCFKSSTASLSSAEFTSGFDGEPSLRERRKALGVATAATRTIIARIAITSLLSVSRVEFLLEPINQPSNQILSQLTGGKRRVFRNLARFCGQKQVIEIRVDL